jgi:hypothetical protein
LSTAGIDEGNAIANHLLPCDREAGRATVFNALSEEPAAKAQSLIGLRAPLNLKIYGPARWGKQDLATEHCHSRLTLISPN